MKSHPVIKVVIVDDHPVVRGGLVGMFAAEPGIDVVGCLTPWHLHDNLCIADGLQIVGLSDWGDCPTGSQNRPTPRMLHVWLIPHEGGPFAGIFT